MTNFIYLSPNFPENHWNFVYHLKQNGINTLGIGDAEYDSLSNDLKNNQGTIFELAEKAVKGTDWVIDKEHSDIIQQFVAEPLYIYKNTAAFSATKLNPDKEASIEAGETLYLFYRKRQCLFIYTFFCKNSNSFCKTRTKITI